MSNIPSYEEVENVIHAFYAKVLHHPQLGPFFEHIDDFAEHEARVVGFWWVSMGGKLENYSGSDMIGKHFPLGIKQEDLEIWLALFSETLEQQLAENKALFWMDKVMKIAARLKQIVIDNQVAGLQVQGK